MKKIKSFAFLVSAMLHICSIQVIHAEDSMYSHSDSATSGDVTLKVEWNDPILGQPTTFHVSATGGSGIYKFNMEAPSYTNPDVTHMRVLLIQVVENGLSIQRSVLHKTIHLQ